MMFTTKMTQLFAVVLGKDSQLVTEVLLREGCMQFVKTSEIVNEEFKDKPVAKTQACLEDVSDLRKRIESFLHKGGIIPETPNQVDLLNRVPVDVEKENEHLDQIAAKRESFRERQRAINQEILKLEDIRRQLELYGKTIADIKLPAKQSLISVQIGKLPASNVSQMENSLKDMVSLSIPLGMEGDIAHYLLISMKRDSSDINKILTNSGWTHMELPNEFQPFNKTVFKDLSSKIKAFTDEQQELETKANQIIKNEAERLKRIWTNLRVNELFYRVQDHFKSSRQTVIFTGWLPASYKQKLTTEINTTCQGRCYLEWNEPGSENAVASEVPVQFNNPSFLAPFQMLVSNFGIPEYGTIDPTPFVMPIYLAMFGLMFPDIGQGLILIILGLLGAWNFRKRYEKEGLYNLSWLIVWCGLSSMLFGALFGSYFGVSLFKPIWFDLHGVVSGHTNSNSVISSVYDILSITVYFGITVIAVGLLFNWINLIRTRKWMELFFDKGGIFGGWIYAGGVYVASYFIIHDYQKLPESMKLFLLVILPSLLLFVKEPYHFFKQKDYDAGKKFGLFTPLNFVMQWIVELLEIFSGYLANTLSFMRVAGLGIAHVCLMISFFTLADMTSGINSVIILILGNILVIGLEGLSAGVQALRLSYYEFFTKFFHGTGELYTPISLNSR